ncbi:MAG: response regulator transcription factor [Oryzomonas sp.]|nr:response regulator transcription factor [Oryzomonas sp.]
MASILIVDDCVESVALMKDCLVIAGFSVSTAHDGEEALGILENNHFDLVVLDLTMPKMDGLEVCRILRGKTPYIPVLILSARGDVTDRITGLETGGDDYLIKPINFMELLARIKALLRLMKNIVVDGNPMSKKEVQLGHLIFDKVRRCIIKEDIIIPLTTKEYSLLSYIAKMPGKVVSKETLLKKVWGYSHSGYNHTIETHINRLRSKIEEDPTNPKILLTIWGSGYKLVNTITNGDTIIKNGNDVDKTSDQI